MSAQRIRCPHCGRNVAIRGDRLVAHNTLARGSYAYRMWPEGAACYGGGEDALPLLVAKAEADLRAQRGELSALEKDIAKMVERRASIAASIDKITARLAALNLKRGAR